MLYDARCLPQRFRMHLGAKPNSHIYISSDHSQLNHQGTREYFVWHGIIGRVSQISGIMHKLSSKRPKVPKSASNSNNMQLLFSGWTCLPGHPHSWTATGQVWAATGQVALFGFGLLLKLNTFWVQTPTCCKTTGFSIIWSGYAKNRLRIWKITFVHKTKFLQDKP